MALWKIACAFMTVLFWMSYISLIKKTKKYIRDCHCQFRFFNNNEFIKNLVINTIMSIIPLLNLIGAYVYSTEEAHIDLAEKINHVKKK